MPAAKLAALQKRLGHEFRQPQLLTEALTHASYLQDHPDAGPHNQRLEFLGDSVLQFVLTDALYRQFPGEREGVLSRHRATLAKGGCLARLARELGLAACLRLNASEDQAGGRERDSILEDAFEAVVGAIYLDSDLETVRRLVLSWYGPLAQRLSGTAEIENPKGRLQELIQPKHGNSALSYEVTHATGPRHAQVYHVAVLLNGIPIGSGSGSSKKLAEEAAARAALATLRTDNRGTPA